MTQGKGGRRLFPTEARVGAVANHTSDGGEGQIGEQRFSDVENRNIKIFRDLFFM